MARLLPLLLLISLLLGVVVFWLRLDMPVRSIDVQGQLDASERAQISATVSGALRGGLLSTDLEVVKEELYRLSWPRHVSVRRIWPDRLRIRVDKAMVVAAWDDAYLTSEGKIVQLAADDADLVVFDCELAAPRAAMDLYQRLQKLAAVAGLRIVRLEENQLGEWRVVFDRQIAVTLGTTDLAERLQRFTHVYRTVLSERIAEVGHVDARYASGVAVSWQSRDVDSTVASTTAALGPGVATYNQTRRENGFR